MTTKLVYAIYSIHRIPWLPWNRQPLYWPWSHMFSPRDQTNQLILFRVFSRTVLCFISYITSRWGPDLHFISRWWRSHDAWFLAIWNRSTQFMHNAFMKVLNVIKSLLKGVGPSFNASFWSEVQANIKVSFFSNSDRSPIVSIDIFCITCSQLYLTDRVLMYFGTNC